MTYPNIRSGAPVRRATAIGLPYSKASQARGTSSTTDPLVPANDDDGSRKWCQIHSRNPFRVIVIATAFLFTVMALCVAVG
jgi:hypothetical protein